jgi:hypothetical protein
LIMIRALVRQMRYYVVVKLSSSARGPFGEAVDEYYSEERPCRNCLTRYYSSYHLYHRGKSSSLHQQQMPKNLAKDTHNYLLREKLYVARCIIAACAPLQVVSDENT